MKEEHKLSHIIKEGFQDMFYIWKDELKQVFRDEGIIIFFFLVPLVYPVLYAYIYNNEVVHEAKMVVVDQSNSPLSREFIRRVDASSEVHVVQVVGEMDEARRLVDSKEAFGILSIPSAFSKDLHQGRQTTVSLYSDMSALLFYKAFLLTATEVSLDMGSEWTSRNHPQSTDKLQAITVQPIPSESISLYNPQNGFASFLVPAILILVIQQTLILGIGMSAGTAREKNRFHTLVPITRHFHGTLRIVLGKSLTYIVLYVVICAWVLVIVPRLFAFPQIGQPLDLILFILPYLFACIFFSMTLSGFVSNREEPMILFVFTSVILVFISGISWPMYSISPFWRALGYIFPSTMGVQGFARINTTGATLNEVAHEYQVLWIQAGVYFITACLVYRYQIIRSRKQLIRHYLEMKRRRESKAVAS